MYLRRDFFCGPPAGSVWRGKRESGRKEGEKEGRREMETAPSADARWGREEQLTDMDGRTDGRTEPFMAGGCKLRWMWMWMWIGIWNGEGDCDGDQVGIRSEAADQMGNRLEVYRIPYNVLLGATLSNFSRS
jgi:hypothetical protein